MRRFLSVPFLVALFLAATYSRGSFGDSSLPPSNPGAAIQLGTLDYPRATSLDDKKYYPCLGYNVVLRADNKNFNTQYFKFSILGKKSTLYAQMRESPAATVWFRLLDDGLNLIQEYRGGDGQKFSRDMDSGSYYLQISTEGSRKNGDGTNTANVVIRALPKPLPETTDTQTEPITIGPLISGTPIRQIGYLAVYNLRKLTFDPQPKKNDCPMGDNVFSDVTDFFQFEAPKGKIKIAVGANYKNNWEPPLQLNIWYEQQNFGWSPVLNGEIDHPGGKVLITIGFSPRDPFFATSDGFMEYVLLISN